MENLDSNSPESVPFSERGWHRNCKIVPEWKSHEEKKVKNFSMVRHEKSCINVYDKDCMGCSSTGADFMLTFGSTIDYINGNNEIKESYNPCHVDVFVTRKQLEYLKAQIEKVLK